MLFLDFVYVSQRDSLQSVKTQLDQANTKLQKLSLEQANSSPVDLGSGAAQAVVQPVAQTTNSACPQSCVTLINNVKNAIPKVGTSPATKASTTTTKGEYVIPLGSGDVSSNGVWVDDYGAQGVVDTFAYANIKAIYFEVVMHLPNGQGEMRAKLIDDSTPFSYDGQVLTSQSQTGQLLSVQVPLVSGRKTYHVQLYSSIGEGVLDSARIRIVTQ